jgi:purine nucleosidase
MRTSILLLLLAGLLCTCDPAPEVSSTELPPPPRHEFPEDKPIKFILDTDSANEIDDLYALAFLLPELDEKIELLGVNSAQWFHVLSGDSTCYRSQKLNEEILTIAGKMDLPHPMGSDMMMGYPWGEYIPRQSPAPDFISEQAMALPEGERLVVMGIGASTNIASALALEPAIVDKIVVYILGFNYFFDKEAWEKGEFNIRRDLNAANYLLNLENLELHVMPTTVAIQYTWDREDTFQKLDQCGEMGAYLKDKWLERFPDNDSWVMWDVALLQAFIKPEQGEEIVVRTPPENEARTVWLYEDIDEDAMLADFWARMEFWQ